MKSIHPLAIVGIVLLIVGGLNWGLVGALSFDLVAYLFGEMSVLARIVYVLVGLSAIGVGIWLPASACGHAGCSPKQPESTA